MPISQTFDVNPLTLQEALYRGGYGIAEAQQFERDRTFNEGTRQFDVKTALEQEAMLMQERLRQEALAQQAMEADYRFQIGQGQLGLDAQRNDLYGQQLENQAAQDEGVTQRAMLGQMGQTVRAREKRNFDMAVSRQDAILKARADNLIDDAQLAEAAQVWEQQTGMPWAFPGQLAAQQDEQAASQRINSFVQMGIDPGTGKPTTSAEEVQAMFDTGMNGKEVSAQVLRNKQEKRNWDKTQHDINEKFDEQRKSQEKHLADMQADNDRIMQQITNQQKQFEERQRQTDLQFQQKMRVDKAKAIRDARMDISDMKKERKLEEQAHAAAKKEADDPSSIAPLPPAENYDAMLAEQLRDIEAAYADMGGQQSTAQLPEPKTPAEVQALPPGTRFKAPDGSIRIR
jgi:hypothetical protein